MFNQYEPNVKATICFLKQLKVTVNKSTVNETLQNHPDWPGLLCITDSLNKWNIPNGAGKIAIDKIDELPVPFAAYTLDSENPLVIVTQVNSETIQLYQKDYNKPITQTKEDFIKTWNGVYLIAEPNEHSGEANYAANKQQAFLKSLVPAAAIGILIIFSLFLLNKIAGAAAFSAIGIYLQYFILLAGVIVTSLLLWYEIDKSNPLLQKVCTGIVKGNCNAILTGKQAKVFSWLSWSEVGFFYFAGSLLVILSNSEVSAGLSTNTGLFVLSWLNILALPYTIFSIYYQWRVAKQWCVLCLAVQALLLLGGINVIANNLLSAISNHQLLIINSLLLFALPALIWFAVKPYILQLQQAKNTKREYLRIKFNTEIFNTLLKKQKALTIPADGLGINLGNPAATNTIIKVCNPYCGPCAKAHPKIDALLEQIPNLKVQIIFNTTNNEEDRGGKPVKHLLAIAAGDNDEKMIKQSLDDWYLAEAKDYDKFAAKYPMNGELLKQVDKIAAMEKWCRATEIAFTPTIFINGYQLPDTYSIEDLKYFLLE
jgi:uncharacterized membrane protein/thiol-disulfide isomerase/thioredoxin